MEHGTVLFAETLTRNGLYPVRDPVPGHPERYFVGGTLGAKGIVGKWTGEKRPPKAGEWYISGAIPECYRAPNDLSTSHAIARLVQFQTRVVVEETPL